MTMTAIQNAPKPRDAGSWIPFALVGLSLVPVASGIVRLNLIASNSAPIPEDTRFLVAPAPVIIHIIAASVFCVLGAFQFSARLRGRNRWHRIAGRLLVPCGLATALSGLWMTLFYPWAPCDGIAVYVLRLVFGSAMAGLVVLALIAFSRRDVRSHAAWMIRAYAIAQGAGTQVLTHLPWFLLAGAPDVTARAWLMGAGWVINIMIAEWIIRRKSPAQHQQRMSDSVEAG
jgi:uncharacterized membrane protein